MSPNYTIYTRVAVGVSLLPETEVPIKKFELEYAG